MMYIVRSFILTSSLALALGCGKSSAGPFPWVDDASEAAPATFSGTVKEELAAGSYTYYRLHLPSDDERWVVVADRKHRGAERFSVEACRPRRDFASRRLKRNFSVLYFCSSSKTQS